MTRSSDDVAGEDVDNHEQLVVDAPLRATAVAFLWTAYATYGSLVEGSVTGPI